MKHGILTLFVATSTLFGAGALSGCEMLGITDTTYTIDVRQVGGAAGTLQSLYVIVAPKDAVAEPLGDSNMYGKLLEQERQNKYTSFLQYQPLEPNTWVLSYKGRENPNVKARIKKQSIKVAIPHKLIGTGSTEYSLIVLAFFGADGFELVAIDNAAIDASADHIVEVGPSSLTLQAAE